MDYQIFPPEEIVEDALIELPPSKSIQNRRALLRALAAEPPEPLGPDASDDARLMAAALEAARQGQPDGKPVEINLELAGTAMRFLTAYFASRPGANVLLTGNSRMLQRPIGPLVQALRLCGAEIEYAGAEGCPPLRIRGRQLQGGTVTVDASVSSQFISALLMVAPLMTQGLTINLDGEPLSLPYILMTLKMMERRGINAERSPLQIVVQPGRYSPYAQSEEEADWSAASYWYEICAVSAGWYSLQGLRRDALQGDRAAASFFECLGVFTVPSEEHPGALDLQPSPEIFGRLELDLSANPDLAPALVVGACLINEPFRLWGMENLKVKECDRLQALRTEMGRLGLEIDEPIHGTLEWSGKRHPILEMPVFDSYGDHRMAMALTAVALVIPGITIRGAECVSKSYPNFWKQLQAVGFTLREPQPPEAASAEPDAPAD